MRRLARLICLLRGHRPVDDRRDLFGRPMTCARCRLDAVAMSGGAHRRFLAAFERMHPHPVCAMGECVPTFTRPSAVRCCYCVHGRAWCWTWKGWVPMPAAGERGASRG